MHSQSHRRFATPFVVALVLALVAAVAAAIPLAAIGFDHGAVVSADPRLDTPRFVDGAVYAQQQIGGRIFVGGSFTEVETSDGTVVAQPYLAAYSAWTGELDLSFRPDLTREVEAIAAAEDGQALFVAGGFNHVNGYHRAKIAKLDLNGNTITAFKANASAVVKGLAVGNGKVYLTGQFNKIKGIERAKLGAVDAVTGAVDTGFDIPLTGGLGNGGSLAGKEVDLTPDGDDLLVVSTAAYYDGERRYGVGFIDVSGPTATLSPWRTRLYEDNWTRCSGGLQLRDGELSPDGSYFVVVGKGHDRPPVCDTAIRFPTAIDPDGDVQADWISRHFDSVYAVAITDAAVYTGGHFRYVPSATAPDPWPGNTGTTYTSPGVLGDDVAARDQIAALDPQTGKALDWVTSTNSFAAVYSLEAAGSGLLLGHDRQLIDGRDIGRHGVFPLTQSDLAPPSLTVTTPLPDSDVAADITIAGTAADDTGVAGVGLSLYNRDDRTWLHDDGTWGSWVILDTDLDTPGAPGTGFSISADGLPDARYKAILFAVDLTGKVSNPKDEVKFQVVGTIDVSAPEVSMSTPTENQLINGAVVVDGNATDDASVEDVYFALYDRIAGQWYRLDDTWGKWQKHPMALDAPGAAATGFSDLLNLAPSRYKLVVFAEDGTGKLSDPKTVVRFEVLA